ncbi:hypothetical protein F4779DRAFT_18289 [Xylariaceae sp. FL0662B]|nr:hypothetical protein F4779DRAFT_18289 [Xylariaceae sp. FL0662B]
MNWTEGNLSRHSRGRKRNALLTRQKQHFAKARSKLLGGSIKQSPRSLSFFGINYSSSSSQVQGISTSAPYTVLASPLGVSKWEQKRPPDSKHGIKSEASAIHEKRRRLLEKSDWVGLDLQKPIEFNFSSQPHAAGNSRWSKPCRPQANTTRNLREPVDRPRSEKGKNIHTHPMRIQIGSQVIQPSVSTASLSGTRRCSLAPSQARRLYVPSRSSQLPQASNSHSHRELKGRESRNFRNAETLKLPEEPVHVVYSSSVIQEPVPRRADDFMVLRWSPPASDRSDSMQVEIERPARPVPPSEEADQATWKNWVLDLSDGLSHQSLPKSPSVRISPLIAVPASLRASVSRSPSQRELPSHDVSSGLGISTSPQRSDLSPIGQEDSQVALENNDCRSPKQIHSHPQQAQSVDNDNKAWLKFVFDDSSEEIEQKAFEEAAYKVARELRPSITPRSMDEATETAATCGTSHWSKDEEEQIKGIFSKSSLEKKITTEGTVTSEVGYSDIATVGSTNIDESESRFRFAPPRMFVGKLADSKELARIQVPPLQHPKGLNMKRKGKGKKRASDGRTDIRDLPDFDGDPIEEFED